MAETLKSIPLELIEFNEANLRLTPTADIHELADSIAFIGLLEPPVVVKNGDLFKLIAGERRVRACELLVQQGTWEAGASIKCIVRSKMTDEQTTAAILIENMQRVDLSAVEQANGVVALAVEHGMVEAEIAENLGVTKQWVKDRIGIHGLPDHVKDTIGKPGFNVTTAGLLASLPQDRIDRLTKDGKVPGQYDVEAQVQKVASEKKGEQTYKKLKKAGALVVTEKELKRILTTDVAELSGDDSVVKAMLAGAVKIMANYWDKSPDTQVKLEQLHRFNSDDADLKTLYVMRKVGGYVEWAKGIVVPGEGKANPDSPLVDVDPRDEVDERNDAKRAEWNAAKDFAEMQFVERTKPAELINTLLWGYVMQIETGYQSFSRAARAAERLGLDYSDCDSTVDIQVQRDNHAINLNALIAYAKKNAANLARAAATVEMVCGRHAFEVEYPAEPEYEEYADADDDELVGF